MSSLIQTVLKPENEGTVSFPTVPENVLKDLLRIGGTNDYGEAKLQLVWGEAETWFSAGKFRLKYPVRTNIKRLAGWNVINSITGEKEYYPASIQPAVTPGVIVAPVFERIDVGYKGWVLQEWWPPEVVCIDWEENRYIKHPHTGEKVDMLGEKPIRGQFRFLMYVDDGQEPPTPLRIDDHRFIETVELAVRLREVQGAHQSWRKIQDPARVKAMMEHITAGREKEEADLDQEFDEFLEDTVATKLRMMQPRVAVL